MYGIFIGGSQLGNDYKLLPLRSFYRFSTQRRHEKTIASIEQKLRDARESITSVKFNGQLEATAGLSTEIGKEKFINLLRKKSKNMVNKPFTTSKTAITMLSTCLKMLIISKLRLSSMSSIAEAPIPILTLKHLINLNSKILNSHAWLCCPYFHPTFVRKWKYALTIALTSNTCQVLACSSWP